MKKYVNGEYIEMSAQEIADMRRAEHEMFIEAHNKPMTDTELLESILGSVERQPMPRLGGKAGFVLKENYVAAENRTVWEYIPDPYYVPVNDGTDYTRPIAFVDGMEVAEGLWYSFDDENVWECIKSGEAHYTDEWFDIVA